MAEENKNTVTAETAAETDNNKAEKQPEAPPPSLADDFLKLEQLNLIRAVTIRMQGGRHPSREIEGLLQRRMNFPREELQGPYVVRLICTIMMVFVAATICWGILWAFSNILELSYFQRLVSTGIATLFAALAGVAIFHPSSIPDEKTLADAIEARMNELRKELGKNEQPTTNQANTDKESPNNKENTETQVSEQPVATNDKAAETDTGAQAETTENTEQQS
ncbi:MAG: hypothetical protein GX569_05535 [Candidatus Riflebacteria bacterium]|nr:hypothetical protein [Candidatus Riflebacteria bacterium]